MKPIRILGHPLHSMLVHFPVALFPFSVVMDGIALAQKEPVYAAAGFFAAIGGVVIGAVAAIFGLLDFIRISSSHPAYNKALIHLSLNVVWMMSFIYLIAVRWRFCPDVPIFGLLEITIGAATVLGMAVSNYLGGDLILRHGIGREELNK
jgi:uncharacterized membrane protein